MKCYTKRNFIVLLFMSVFSAFSFAQSVSKEKATRVALSYVGVASSKFTPLDTTHTYTLSIMNQAPLYVVQMNEGWVLVSSEKALPPILAFSPTGHFPDTLDMPDGMKWLLTCYGRAMRYAKDSLSSSIVDDKWFEHITSYDNSGIPQRGTPLESLFRLKTVAWGQSKNNSGSCIKPYNKFCPTWYATDCGHTCAGCDAVALAQVLWFYQWPHSAAIPNSISGAGEPSEQKHIEYYDWSLMPAALTSITDINEVNSVAGLLRDCGFASNMIYDIDGSYTQLQYVESALENTFHYKNVTRKVRKNYIGNWINKLKSELDAGRPIIYAGSGDDGGHGFILYGYTSDNKFRINWGWRGYEEDAVFSLDSMHTIYGDFNDNQEALLGIEPNYPTCNDFNLTSLDIISSPFEYFKGGDIYVQNKTISGKTGVIYSGEAVHLLPTCTISAGSNIHIAVRDMHCGVSNNRGEDEMILAPTREETPTSVNTIHAENSFAVFPNPAMDRVTISSTEPIAQTMFFNLSGQLVLQTAEKEVDVSNLSPGAYIVRALLVNGETRQTKIVHL